MTAVNEDKYMSNEHVYFEIESMISEELCKESIIKIFTTTKKLSRWIDLVFALLMFLGFLFEIFVGIVNQYLNLIVLSVITLLCSCYMIYSYFKGYSYPSKIYLRKIKKMSNPAERRYKFYESYFEEYTNQSTQRVDYQQIKRIINTKNALILMTDNTQFVLNKMNFENNVSELISFLRNATSAKYYI